MKTLLLLVKRFWLPLTILLIIIIASLSLYPLKNLPPLPGTDKTHHFIAYAALIFPVALAKPRHDLAIFIAMIAFGGAIELIQPYVNRYGEWLDMAANTGGLCCGWILASIMNHLFCRSDDASDIVKIR